MRGFSVACISLILPFAVYAAHGGGGGGGHAGGGSAHVGGGAHFSGGRVGGMHSGGGGFYSGYRGSRSYPGYRNYGRRYGYYGGGYGYPVYLDFGFGGGGYDYGSSYYGGGYEPGYSGGYDGGGYGPPPPVVINQGFAPEVLRPQVRDYGPPDEQENQPAPVQNPALSATSPYYLIALKDGPVLIAVAYWTKGGVLHYVTKRDKVEKQVPLTGIDRDLTEQLNSERHVQIRLGS